MTSYRDARTHLKRIEFTDIDGEHREQVFKSPRIPILWGRLVGSPVCLSVGHDFAIASITYVSSSIRLEIMYVGTQVTSADNFAHPVIISKLQGSPNHTSVKIGSTI